MINDLCNNVVHELPPLNDIAHNVGNTGNKSQGKNNEVKILGNTTLNISGNQRDNKVNHPGYPPIEAK